MREPIAVICEMSQGIVVRTTKQILAVIQARWFRHTDLQCEDGGRSRSFLRKSYHENFPEIVYFNTEAERGEALKEIVRLMGERK